MLPTYPPLGLPECPPAVLAYAGGYSPAPAAPLEWGRPALETQEKEDEGLE